MKEIAASILVLSGCILCGFGVLADATLNRGFSGGSVFAGIAIGCVGMGMLFGDAIRRFIRSARKP